MSFKMFLLIIIGMFLIASVIGEICNTIERIRVIESESFIEFIKEQEELLNEENEEEESINE